MFCDTCHWYTAGESICRHCGAKQKPKPAKDVFNLPGDVSVLDDSFMDSPLAGTPMPVIEASSLKTVFQPFAAPPPVPAPGPQPPPPQAVRFCGRCGKRAGAGNFCPSCGTPLPQMK